MGGTRRDLVGFQLSGSYEKGTAITLGAHVDILVSVKKPGDAKDVYMSLYPHCLDKHLPPEAHGVGIRISSKGVKVHIIPWNLDRVEQEGSNGHARNGHHTLYHHRQGRVIETDLSKRQQLYWPSFISS